MGQALNRVLTDRGALQQQQQQAQQQEAAEVTVQQSQQRQAATVGDMLDPVVSWEKNDIEFWLQIAQLFVLILILREVNNG